MLTAHQQQLLPTAAALTVAGILVGGAGAVILLDSPNPTDDLAANYDPADLMPPDRGAAVDRGSRSDARTEAATPPPTTTPPAARVLSTGSCQASFYSGRQRTANGETLNSDQLTAAHRTLPFGTMVRITNVSTGHSVIVRINDRGPYVGGRCLNLSRAAFDEIASLDAGVVSVRYEVLAQDAT